jgi:elongation factor Ts
MSKITAALVKELREKTDAPMMECKKALSESNGELEKAEEILRVKLGSKASKTASRITAEGIVAIAISDNLASMVEINCETDFVAKNNDFIRFANDVAKSALNEESNDIQKLLKTPTDNNQTIEERRSALIGKIGENITIRRFIKKKSSGSFFSYLHGAKIGVILDLSGGNEVLGKDIAMHIAAMKPKAVKASDVDTNLIDKEKRVAKEKALESGKPPEIMEKMVNGAIKKYLKEVSLYGQIFVKSTDGKETVEELVKKSNASVESFELYVVGEGLEKKLENFAAEVAATSAAAKVV